ncbi:MAG TPA: hypothetical protein VFT06_10255 [Flavisolibacter sp.]|nr:hypothetical protein [Flavisolibacter sp.]
MKVKFLKDFQQYKAGEEADVPEARATYWRNVGLVEGGKEKKETTVTKKATPAATKKAAPEKTGKKKQTETPKTKN